MAMSGWWFASTGPTTEASSSTRVMSGAASAALRTVAAGAESGGGSQITNSRFTNYTSFVATAPVDWRFELIAPDGSLLATTNDAEAVGDVIKWGARADVMGFSPLGVSVRDATLTFPLTDTAMIPRSRASLLHPESGNRVRMYAGIVVDGTPVWWTQATMLIDDVEITSGGGLGLVDLALMDASSALRVELTQSFVFDAGEAVEAVVARLMALVIPDQTAYDIASTGYTVPGGSFPPGESIDELIEDLLGGCGHELTADHNGILISREIAPSTADPQQIWRYGQTDGIPVRSVKQRWSQLEPQGWIVEGGSLEDNEPSITVTVYDTDPTSIGYYEGGGQQVSLPSTQFSFVGTRSQGAKAAYGLLRRSGTGPGTVEMVVAPNAAMRPGDVVDLEYPDIGASGLYIVREFGLPFEISQGATMSVRLRALWDPEVGVPARVDAQPGFTAAASDDFAGSDRNLQSADWNELGWSWWIYNEQAVQQYDGDGWSMALWNTALQHSNHSSTVTIAKAPTNKPVGPVIRSSGNFDGYAALIDHDGVIRLESWVGGKFDRRLGSYDTGVAPLDRVLTLKAVGSTITVEIDDVDVLTATDERHLGLHVGFLALGGPPSNAPTVDDWSAAEAS